jgi:hypothetical protein
MGSQSRRKGSTGIVAHTQRKMKLTHRCAIWDTFPPRSQPQQRSCTMTRASCGRDLRLNEEQGGDTTENNKQQTAETGAIRFLLRLVWGLPFASHRETRLVSNDEWSANMTGTLTSFTSHRIDARSLYSGLLVARGPYTVHRSFNSPASR